MFRVMRWLPVLGLILAAGCAKPAAVDEKPAPEPVAEKIPEPTPVPTDTRPAGDPVKEEFQRLMVDGASALAARKYPAAITAYQDALLIYPDNIDAAKGLAEARTALEARGAEQEETQKKQAELARLLKQGQEAMAAKQYAEAVRALDQALLLAPSDAAATKALAEAREALAADQGEKKKLAEYQDHITAGKAALAAQRSAEALREFNAALRLLPGDAVATQGVKDAEKLLDALQDQEKRKAEYNTLMAQAGAALKNQRYDEAVRAYARAEKLFPKDADALKGISDAQRSAAADVQAEYTRIMRQGDAAYRAQQFADAAANYAAALKLVPNDAAATQSLRQTQATMQALAARQADYERLMQLGQAALRVKRFPDAIRAFGDALKVAPNDGAALAGLREASYSQNMTEGDAALRAKRFADAVREFQAALNDVPDDRNAMAGLKQAQAGLDAQQDRKEDYDKHMRAGANAMQQRRFADAIREFENALREVPNDPNAMVALKQARAAQADNANREAEFNKRMRAGQQLMNNKKFADAAREFEAALQLMPNDREAQAALKRARSMMGKK